MSLPKNNYNLNINNATNFQNNSYLNNNNLINNIPSNQTFIPNTYNQNNPQYNNNQNITYFPKYRVLIKIRLLSIYNQ